MSFLASTGGGGGTRAAAAAFFLLACTYIVGEERWGLLLVYAYM